MIHLKNKRLKKSSLLNSNKKKIRKQVKAINFYNQNGGHYANSYKMNDTFAHSNDATHNNAPIRKEVVIDDAGETPESDFTTSGSGYPSLGSGFTYKRKPQKRTYLYGFTDSKFIYFLATLEPRAYLIFITLIALLITEDLNVTESKIIFVFILNVADTMQTIVEQEVILSNYEHTKFHREQGDALQKDFETLYSEISRLKREVNHSKS